MIVCFRHLYMKECVDLKAQEVIKKWLYDKSDFEQIINTKNNIIWCNIMA